MKSNAPWSVKGIERDAREAAKEAARREGMTVGEWLNQMIYSQGQEQSSSQGEVEGLRLRDIVTAIEHLRNRIVDAEKQSGESVNALTRNVGGVVERLQRLERIKQPEGTYEDLATRIEMLEDAGGDRNRIDALKALEKAVAHVASQFSSAQKTTLHRLDSAEQQLQEFAERIDQVGSGGEPADIGSLKSTIEGLAERVARAEKVASEAAALRDAASSSGDPEFVEQTGAKLRVLGDEIKRGGDQIRAFEGAIVKLSQQIEAAEKRSADGVQKVAEAIAEVHERIKRGGDEGDSALEAKLEAARQETDERIAALQASLAEISHRMQNLGAGAPSAAEHGAKLAAVPSDTGARKKKDPFAFEDDEVQAESGDHDGDDALEDFSFELDDEPEGEQAAPQEKKAQSDDGARSRFAQVRSALSAGEPDQPVSAEAPTNVEDEIEAILGELENDEIPFGDDYDEDEQAAGTGSLTPGSNIDHEEEDDGDSALTDDEEQPSDTHAASAADRAQKPAADSANDAKRPTRRNLTAKQRAILAARARQKLLAAKASKAPEEDAPEASMLAAPAKAEAAYAEDEGARPSGPIAKITSGLSAVRTRLGRAKKRDDASGDERQAYHNAANLSVGRAPSADAAPKSGDRAALETLKATTSARPLTMALAFAIILAVAALAYLVKDFVFPADKGAQNTPTITRPAETPDSAVATPENQPAAGDSDLPAVPEAPAIDPKALYGDAMSELDAAGDEAAAAGAISKLRDAAALGYPPAQLQLGELYKTGQGVEQDLGQARVWFRRAANGGNVLAMHRIGVMTARGDGGPADTEAAIAWFEQAANFGLVDSQYNLGAIYHPSENGGAMQDAERAYYWYSLAAQNGDQAAQPLATTIAAGLTEAERAAVDERVSEWKAEESDPAANTLSQG